MIATTYYNQNLPQNFFQFTLSKSLQGFKYMCNLGKAGNLIDFAVLNVNIFCRNMKVW